MYDRYMVRMLEMRESVKILEQALRDIPAGPIMDAKTKIGDFVRRPERLTGGSNRRRESLGFS